MNAAYIEGLMYQVSGLLLTPVLIVITVLFFYSFFVLGCFGAQAWQRKRNGIQYRQLIMSMRSEIPSMRARPVKGFGLFSYYQGNRDLSLDDLEIFALKQLEKQRVVTRVAPMLGLVATMIPMGPALKSLADGNIQGISENLIVAFAAVVFGLVAASITFWTASVKKRWYAVELNDLQPCIAGKDG